MENSLKILKFPDPRLRTVAQQVKKFDKSLKKLADDMLDVMYKENGIGLAATQVNHHIRLIVIDVSEEKNEPRYYVNPAFEVLNEDSCMSLHLKLQKQDLHNTLAHFSPRLHLSL